MADNRDNNLVKQLTNQGSIYERLRFTLFWYEKFSQGMSEFNLRFNNYCVKFEIIAVIFFSSWFDNVSTG